MRKAQDKKTLNFSYISLGKRHHLNVLHSPKQTMKKEYGYSYISHSTRKKVDQLVFKKYQSHFPEKPTLLQLELHFSPPHVDEGALQVLFSFSLQV